MSTLSAEKRATIVRLRQEGKSKDACRKATGATWETVNRVLYQEGLEEHPPKLAPSRQRAPKPVEEPAPVRRRPRRSAPSLPLRSRPSPGDFVAPLQARNPFAGRGCPTGTCRNLVGCSCGAPRAARHLSPDEVEKTPVRTDFRIADESARGGVGKGIFIVRSPRARKAFREAKGGGR